MLAEIFWYGRCHRSHRGGGRAVRWEPDPKLAHSLGSARREFKKGLDEESVDGGVETVKVVDVTPQA